MPKQRHFRFLIQESAGESDDELLRPNGKKPPEGFVHPVACAFLIGCRHLPRTAVIRAQKLARKAHALGKADLMSTGAFDQVDLRRRFVDYVPVFIDEKRAAIMGKTSVVLHWFFSPSTKFTVISKASGLLSGPEIA